MQLQQESNGSRSPYHFYEFCLPTNHRAVSPAIALDQSRPVQAPESSWLPIQILDSILDSGSLSSFD